jgi:hypothetical protein
MDVVAVIEQIRRCLLIVRAHLIFAR